MTHPSATPPPPGTLWHDTAPPLFGGGGLSDTSHYDLVIIGGGFTGLSAALHAARTGASTLLLEAREIGHGGSGRNVGLVNAGLWLPPGDVARKLGPEAAHRLTSVLATGPALVFDLISTLQIDCEAVTSGTLHCAHAPSGMAELERRYRQLIDTGAPVQLLPAEEARRRVGTDQVHGALFDPRAGTINPLAYARGLARAARAAGAQIVEGMRADTIRHGPGGWRITCGDNEICADAVIEATNAYGMARNRFAPLSFFQVATDPLPPEQGETILPGGEGCWDTALVMSSFRRDAAGRIILGGIGSLGHPLSGVHRLWAGRKLRRLFPQLAGLPFTHEWFGRIATTADHLPRIQRLGPRGYAAFGYSGRGIGPGTLFGRALAQAALTGEEGDLPLTPVDHHAERFRALRGVWYETGALAAHALGSIR
ncbi:NAD(P)/FAD-dependent oxidoreductase [Pseudooceanicola sp.]|uniref:NAD(P)/FAD-dependent oxidoreductase n=1 Tax=Pseudooceanicola sp. TaxID=1914328 RepID=UPI0035C6CE99